LLVTKKEGGGESQPQAGGGGGAGSEDSGAGSGTCATGRMGYAISGKKGGGGFGATAGKNSPNIQLFITACLFP